MARFRTGRWLALAGLLAFLPCSGATAREAASAIPDIALPDRFEIPGDPAAAPDARTDWWTLFGDPGLDALMGRLHAGNTGIRQAEARLSAARAFVKAGTASQAPALGLDVSATHAEGPLVNAAGDSGNLFTARVNAGWELDLLGRFAGDRAAERLDAKAANALLQDMTLLMEAEAARSWFAARHLATAAADARRVAGLLEDAAAIAERRLVLGMITPVRLDAARQRLAVARTRANALSLGSAQALRHLGFLLGEPAPAHLAPTSGGPVQIPAVPAGLPADLLSRRPDIAWARDRLMAADERLRSAKNGWMPVLGLTASGGGASTSLGQLFSAAAGSFGLGALLSIPIFDGGRSKARIAGRRSERDLAEAQYRERVLAALRDANNGLQVLEVRRQALADASEGAANGEKILGSVRARAANGTVSRIDVIDAEVEAADRRIARSEAAGASLVAVVDLLQALGGSWKMAAATSDR